MRGNFLYHRHCSIRRGHQGCDSRQRSRRPFALDGMPGRQMAIDADLAPGLIDHAEAIRRRESLVLQADFYGAMDGASKFVRGDAIAAIVITCVNIFGGLIIGLTQNLSLAQAADVFTRLTIGEGLSCQIPAFLIALSPPAYCSLEIPSRSICRQPSFNNSSASRSCWRWLPFSVALSFHSLARDSIAFDCRYLLSGGVFPNAQRPAIEPAIESPGTAAPADDAEGRFDELLRVDMLEIEIGVNLIPLADPRRGGDLLKRIAMVRSEIASEIGIILPKLTFEITLPCRPMDIESRSQAWTLPTDR